MSSVVATRIRKGAQVVVSGKGRSASEIIANSDGYVRTAIVKLNKSGYIQKRFLSDTDASE
jgi:hypothetical protein